ncbi:MAG: hypothetical protein WBH44_09230 [Proteocatella sp.]
MKSNKKLDMIKKEKIIICNIAWMREYNGITRGDVPLYHEDGTAKGDSAGEIYNFQEFNGNCYGYMEKYGNMEIERYFSKFFGDRDKIGGFTIVWCATNIGKKTEIVGWYKNAVINRNHRYVVDFFPEANDDNGYNAVASIEDCYLIPEDKRAFVVDEILTIEELFKLKDSSIWYEDGKNQNKALAKIKEYIESYDGDFSNEGTFIRFLDIKAEDSGDRAYEELYDRGMQLLQVDATEAIKYFNSARSISETPEVIFNTGVCLQEISCFDRAIEFYARTLEMKPDKTEVLLHILICYAKKGDAQNTLALSKKLIRVLKLGNHPLREDMLVDVYFIISNAYIFMNQFKDARNTIKKILGIRQETEDKLFVQDVLDIIEEVEQDFFYRC